MSAPADPRAAAWDPADRIIAFVTSRALLLGATLGLAYLTVAVTGDSSLTDPLIPGFGSGFGFGLVLVPPLAGALTLVVWLFASAAVRLARLSRVAALVGIGLCAVAEAAIVGAGILSVMDVRPVSVAGAVVLAGGSAALLLRAHGAVGGRARTSAV
ncbi:hypothetical protein FGG90_09565 [Clavibacter tessellarius]|uniref:Uncharacterized protein n=1 Tax=Clavibacter tessellarius TaxID=31965 RepID=A0A225C7I4_9MICO|nr:hypothetical protein [Clavibacter michiganensis]OQJ62787.1 hypothetical protein B5P24_07160 [Clavibacter michiganensis subsp. tessellarius]UKF34226.1 hypothetical protein FGG90_09565 [Clavibacter michiganensis subsp. tessellarius]